MSDQIFKDNDYCFACGGLNPLGLHLKFRSDGEFLTTRFTPREHLQGFEGVLHGGIIAVILDDLMSNLLARRYSIATATAELKVRFRAPAKVGIQLMARAWVKDRKGKIFYCQAELMTEEESAVLATAEGTFVAV